MNDPECRVILYTIPEICPLCDEARSLLEKEQVLHQEVDIRTDKKLLRAYRLEIPVVTVDGKKEFIGRIDLSRLRDLLSG